MIDIIANFGLEIVVGILIAIVLLQHRRMNALEDISKRSRKDIINLELHTDENAINNAENFGLHAAWIRRVEAKIDKETSEDESDVQLLQEASKKIH
jgi:hypothetical protein